MIPKKIHYCWFGGNPLPEFAQKCIASWKKFLPDYEIIEWNESNYDVRKITYISQAYDAKKYAFVSDYARFDIVYENGGIYFDTDVEVIKDMTEILKCGSFAGLENAGAINVGLGFAASQREPILEEILDSYKTEKFLNADGSYNLKTVVTRVSDIFKCHGFTGDEKIQQIAGITIYPMDFFCPKNFETGVLRITENTYTIHHYDASWVSQYDKEIHELQMKLFSRFGKNFISHMILLFLCCCKRIKTYGIKEFIIHNFKRIKRKK